MIILQQSSRSHQMAHNIYNAERRQHQNDNIYNELKRNGVYALPWSVCSTYVGGGKLIWSWTRNSFLAIFFFFLFHLYKNDTSTDCESILRNIGFSFDSENVFTSNVQKQYKSPKTGVFHDKQKKQSF